MKIRQSFVANSSSSSFVILTLGNENILEDGDTDLECCGGTSIDINGLILKLQEAKANGITELSITHGGGHD